VAGNIKDLIVRILVDDSDISKFEKAGSKALTFGNVLDKAAIGSAAVLAGLASGAVLTGQAASELEQSAGGIDAVFGNMAQSMHDNASKAADAVGLSENEFNQFATVIGAQMKNAGVPMDQLGGKTQELIGRASDLAATFGGTTSDAVEALSAAMKGEMDPIEKYGISLNASMLKQQAAAMGVSGAVATWDVATKQQVILAAVNQQGADAWGQFAAQSGTAAEKQQVMTANISNASAKIGSVFLPIMAQGADALAKFGRWASANSGLVQGLGIGVGVLAGAVLLASGAYKGFMAVQAITGVINGIRAAQAAATLATEAGTAATAANTVATWANNVAWLASPVTWIILAIIVAIGLLVAAAIWLYDNWDEVTQWIGEAFQNVADWFVSVGEGIAEWWNGLWSGIGNFLTDTWNNAVSFVSSLFLGYVSFLFGIGDGIAKWWNGLWSGIGDFFSGIWNGLQDIVRGAWNGIIGWIEDGVNNAIGLINGIIRGINNVGGSIGIHLNLIPNVHIPRLATGGITTGPMLAMVGDNPGGREAILPLDSPAARDLLGGGSGPIKIDRSSIDELARAVASYVRNQNRQGGYVS
jgi:hypothetical protein